MMTPRGWFVVGLRLLGAWLVTQAFSALLELLEVQFGMFFPQRTAASVYLFHAIMDLVAAALLMWGAVPLSNVFNWRIDPEPVRGFPIEPSPESHP